MYRAIRGHVIRWYRRRGRAFRTSRRGSQASATSKKTELKLTNVARASLEELKLDYEDFLRQHGLRLWGKDDPGTLMLRSAKLESIAQLRRLAAVLVGRLADQSDKADASDRESLKAEVTANCALVLIEQATYLLNRLIERLARDFVDEGGFTERLYRVRTEARASRK